MTSLRRHLLRRRLLAFWLIAAALAVRLLVPAGFMTAVADGKLVMTVCPGHGAMAMAAPAEPGGGDRHDHHDRHDRVDAPCAFGALAMAGLAGADPLVIALALAFVMMTAGVVAPRRPPAAPARLRPPPIGPPLPI